MNVSVGLQAGRTNSTTPTNRRQKFWENLLQDRVVDSQRGEYLCYTKPFRNT